jgi:pilus assembly protein CpaC
LFAGLLVVVGSALVILPAQQALAQQPQEQPGQPQEQPQPQPQQQPPAPQPRREPPPAPRRVRVVPEGMTGATTGAARPGTTDVTAEPQRVIPLYPGEARLIDAPWPVARVSVANPEIADVDVVNPQQVQLIGIAPGVTNLILWSKDERTWRARVEVEPDLSKLQGQLQKVLPRSELEVTQVGDVIVVKGTLPLAEQAVQLRQFLETSKLNHLDLTRIAGSQQVQLKVRIAEVSRNALKQLNVNMFYAGERWFGGNQLGSSASPFTQVGGVFPGDPVSIPPTAQLFAGFPNSDLLVFIQALAENQYLRLLAEPTLVAYSGEEARFLVGGEVPIPISDLGEGTTSISIEYREYGVRLRFRPTVTGEGGIRLVVEPEVSELTDVGSIEILGSRIPALLTRRVTTTMELKSGQTFAMAGLLNQSTNARKSRIPGLGDLPIIGTLFRSVRYSTAETELVILVTASLVEPQSEPFDTIPYPGVTFVRPNDWEVYIDNSIEGKQPRQIAPVRAARLKELGLDKLNGPGAWASYEGRTEAPKAPESSNGAKSGT